MKSLVIFFLFAILYQPQLFATQKDNCQRLDSTIITSAIRQFNDSLRTKKLTEGKYEVYVMHIYKDKNEDVSFLISYIVNSRDFNMVSSNFYFWVDSLPVLINNRDSNFVKEIHDLKIENSKTVFFDEGLIRIVQRLIPNVIGYGINANPSILKVTLRDCSVFTEFFKFSTDFNIESVVPPENRIRGTYQRIND